MASSPYASKFRHIYGDPAKPAFQFTDLKDPMTSGESCYVKANSRFLAYGKSTGGAPVTIIPLNAPGRQKLLKATLSTHKGRLTDFDFHPFIDTIIATCADDCKVNINKFPSDSASLKTANITTPEISIGGHKKKIALVLFNPSANNIIASGSYDRTVKIFNISNGAPLSSYDKFGDNIYSICWNTDGSMLGVTSKDKILRCFDPRQTNQAIEIKKAFEGIKATKCFWVQKYQWIGSTGFSKAAKRQLKLWDPRNIIKPIKHIDIDSSSGVLTTHMDNDLGILYLAGKGEGSVSFYELYNDDKIVHVLGTFRSSISQKGGGFVPKKGLDVFKCEVQRYLKLTRKAIVPVSFIVPRKSGSDVFQDDIFPNCASGKPAITADEWSNGTNADPLTMSMDPDQRDDNIDDDDNITFQKKKTYDEICVENTQLKSKVKSLELEILKLKQLLSQQNNNNTNDQDDNKDNNDDNMDVVVDDDDNNNDNVDQPADDD